MRRAPFAALLLASILAACGHGDAPPPVTTETPPEHQQGEALLQTHCSQCHGTRAEGTDLGPPLVHRIYEPSHHGDASFQLAVARGVRAHHWRFGDMAAVPGVSEAEVSAITDFIRWLQREAGIQ